MATKAEIDPLMQKSYLKELAAASVNGGTPDSD
jgi:hypothetical protein